MTIEPQDFPAWLALAGVAIVLGVALASVIRDYFFGRD